MNEQLQKIAEDAGVDARTMGFESNQHHRDPWNARLEKFAKLIIEECAHVAVFNDSGTVATADVAGHMASGRSIAARLIKEHFGVEE